MLCEIKLILYTLAAAISFSDMHVYAKNSECKKKRFCEDPVKHNVSEFLHACLSIHALHIDWFFISHPILYLILMYTKTPLAHMPHPIFLQSSEHTLGTN